MASFEQVEQAEQAAERLRREGFAPVEVNRVSSYPGDATKRRVQPLSGRIRSLSSLTMGVPADDRDAGAALAAHPSASGLAGGPGPRMAPYLLTAVVPDGMADRVAAIVKEHGGML